jgi:SAM-dependent methyltransferase
MPDKSYIGKELYVFAKAVKWKEYFKSVIAPYLGTTILEVGAGIGATARILCSGRESEWICLEPDPSFRVYIDSMIASGMLPGCCKSRAGVIQDLACDEKYDAILYIDVLEHIEDDSKELETAAKHLGPGGYLIVMAPAHDFLFSPFDHAIGHYRRYSRKSLGDLTPVGCRLHILISLDVLGLLPSLANKLVLKQSLPNEMQILFWDRLMVPLSRLLDKSLNYRFGRSMVAVWKRV